MLRAKTLFFTVAFISALCVDASGQCGASITRLDTSASFSIRDRGAVVSSTSGANSGLTVGYAEVQASPGSTTPAGSLVFSFRENGVLVSETSVPAVRPITSGRIYAAYFGPVNTGVAMVNPNSTDAIVSFYFTPGSQFCDCPNPPLGTFTLPAHSQISRFVNEAPFNVSFGPSFGSMTFSSSVPIGVTALRGYTNLRGEFLMTTLPIADLSEPASNDVVFFPHYADGGGWTTEVTLVNPTDTSISGSVQFLVPGGATTQYSIPPGDVARINTPGIGETITTGTIRITPDPGSTSPSGLAIFTFTSGSIVVSEAAVPALRPAESFRLFDEECNSSSGRLQTGVAIANPSSVNTATVTLDLSDVNGNSTGQTSSLIIPPLGHSVAFMKQFPGLQSIPDLFVGVVRISTTSPAGIAVIGLRSEYNERNDFLITTSVPVNETTPPSSAALFPDLADGGGYDSEFVLFSGSPGQTSAGTLHFFSQSGGRLN